MYDVGRFQIAYVESKFDLHDAQRCEQQSARLNGVVEKEWRMASLGVHQEVDE
jgi:hypothetical protein